MTRLFPRSLADTAVGLVYLPTRSFTSLTDFPNLSEGFSFTQKAKSTSLNCKRDHSKTRDESLFEFVLRYPKGKLPAVP